MRIAARIQSNRSSSQRVELDSCRSGRSHSPVSVVARPNRRPKHRTRSRYSPFERATHRTRNLLISHYVLKTSVVAGPVATSRARGERAAAGSWRVSTYQHPHIRMTGTRMRSRRRNGARRISYYREGAGGYRRTRVRRLVPGANAWQSPSVPTRHEAGHRHRSW